MSCELWGGEINSLINALKGLNLDEKCYTKTIRYGLVFI